MSKPDPFVDLDIESQIDWQASLLSTAKTREGRAAAMKRLQELNALRTPEHIKEMELARGIHR